MNDYEIGTREVCYATLRAALLDLGTNKYEQVRKDIITVRGYDWFRTLQNEVFAEIGTLRAEISA